MKPLSITKNPDGTLSVKGLQIWSTGTFHGHGSPGTGDQFGISDLDTMAQTYSQVGHKLRARMYAGHPLNPTLKMLARPQGRITRAYRVGDRLLADLDDVNQEFWDRAKKDGARLSPDLRMVHRDSESGTVYPLALVGLGVLGSVQPANSALPALDEYGTHYYEGADEVRSYTTEFGLEENMGNLDTLENKIEAALQEDESHKAKVAETLTGVESNVAALQEQARSYSEAFDAQKVEIESLRAEVERQKGIAQAQAVGQTLSEIRSFSEALVDEGKITPALSSKVQSLLQVAANLDGEVRSYALDERGEDAEQSVYALTREILSSLETSSVIKRTQAPLNKLSLGDGTAQRVDVRRYQSDPEANKALYERTVEIQTAEGLSYQKAFEKAVQEGGN